MMSIKAIARTMWILIIIIIILAAGLIGTVVYFGYKPPGGVTVPGFVNDNKIIIEGTGTTQYLDPHVSYYQFDYWILQNTAETLLWYNGSSATDIVPWLVESMPTEVAGTNKLVWEFKLRSNIKFQDGTPLNSTAVWFSFNRLLIKDGTSGSPTKPRHGSQAAWIVQQVLDPNLAWALSGTHAYDAAWVDAVLAQNFVEIIDNLTFRLHLKTATSQLQYLLAGEWAVIVSPSSIIPKDYSFNNWGTWDGVYRSYFLKTAGIGNSYFCVPTQGWKIGSGPFTLDSFSATTHNWVLKKNTNYWGGPPFALKVYPSNMVNEIDYIFQESFSTRLIDLQAGTATGIATPADQLYSVINRTAWETSRTANSIISGNTFYGPFATFVSDWLNFDSNVTDAAGNLLTFQPMADRRIRLAITHSVNLTDANLFIMNGLYQVSNGLLPPNTAPAGVYNSSLTVPWTYDLKKAAELLLDARDHPLTSFTYFNGTPIAGGVIDNSFGPTNPRNIVLYAPSGATDYQKVWTTIATNLNNINVANNTGLTFSVQPETTGQLYSLAEEHRVYDYWGGWMADYNHVIDWLGPMYVSTQSYFSWNLWNITALDSLYNQAVAADEAGNVAELVRITNRMNSIANQGVYYFWMFYEGDYFIRSSFLKGWYYCPALGVEYFGTMYYQT